MLKITNLTASIDGKIIINNLSYQVEPGTCLLITGHNGAGKSTLLHAIMGRSDIEVTGSILLNDSELIKMPVHERAKLGAFLAHQSPPTIDGVNTMTLYKEIRTAHGMDITLSSLIKQIKDISKNLNLPDDWTKRNFNNGASGGERKKNELAQAEFLKHTIKLLLLDEPDSGLEQTSRQRIVDLIKETCSQNAIVLLVTHDKELQKLYGKNSLDLSNA
jgi:Fe-S cluster assembly ATP-binding protein